MKTPTLEEIKHHAAEAIRLLETIRTERVAVRGLPAEATAISAARVELAKIWPEIDYSGNPEQARAAIARATQPTE